MIPSSTDSPRLSDHPILFFSRSRHDETLSSASWHLSAALAKSNRVIYIDQPYTFTEAIAKLMNGAVRRRIQSYTGNYFFLKDGVEVLIAPFIWPLNFIPKGKLRDFFSGWNQRILAKRVNRFFKSSNIESVIYVNSCNYDFPELHKRLFPEVILNVFHCPDTHVMPEVKGSEQELRYHAVQNADMIISTSPSLQQHFISKGFENSYLVPEGSDFKLHSKALNGMEVYSGIAHMKGKVLGYLGNIDNSTDFKLLLQIIQLLPDDWTLVLAGPIDYRSVPNELLGHHRVRFPGPIPQEDAPAVVKRFDVAMVPFTQDDVNKNRYPVKVFDYLAAGKPVVTTNFYPEILSEFNAVIGIASTPAEFADRVLAAYATDSAEMKQARVEAAAQNTWDERVRLFKSFLNQQPGSSPMTHQPVTVNMKPVNMNTSSEKGILSNPAYRKFILSPTYSRKPYNVTLRWYAWLGFILPKYFKKGVSLSSHLELVPFNKFSFGKYSCIDHGAVVNNVMGDVLIEDEVHAGTGSVLIGPVTLHRHVELSPYVRVMGVHQGNDADSPHYTQPCTAAPIIMEENVWVGTGTVVMGKKNGQPLVLGKYCRIGANSIVIDDIPAYSIAVGSPAKVVRVWDFDNNCWVKPATKPGEPEVNVSEVASYIAEVTDYIAMASSYIPEPKPSDGEDVKMTG